MLETETGKEGKKLADSFNWLINENLRQDSTKIHATAVQECSVWVENCPFSQVLVSGFWSSGTVRGSRVDAEDTESTLTPAKVMSQAQNWDHSILLCEWQWNETRGWDCVENQTNRKCHGGSWGLANGWPCSGRMAGAAERQRFCSWLRGSGGWRGWWSSDSMTIVLCYFFPFYATFYLYGADLWVFILSEGNERTANEPCLAENERLKLSLVKLIKGRFLAANGEPRFVTESVCSAVWQQHQGLSSFPWLHSAVCTTLTVTIQRAPSCHKMAAWTSGIPPLDNCPHTTSPGAGKHWSLFLHLFLKMNKTCSRRPRLLPTSCWPEFLSFAYSSIHCWQMT